MNLTIPFFPPTIADLTEELKAPREFIVKDFQCPWESAAPSATTFTAHVDKEWFYFFFDVHDNNIYTVPFEKKADVASGDRVEIFLSGDDTLQNYYCIEISPEANVLDYQASYHRVFDEDWKLDDLHVESIPRFGGYMIEGKIPLSFMQSISQNITSEYFEIYLGLYRANYQQMDDGSLKVQWISWIKPDTVHPDFHVPSAFCKVKVELGR